MVFLNINACWVSVAWAADDMDEISMWGRVPLVENHTIGTMPYFRVRIIARSGWVFSLSQLTAGGIDVAPTRTAEVGNHAFFAQRGDEGFGGFV